jgi:predicted MFS family arabinose efflux permease
LRYPLFLIAALISLAGDWLTTVAVGVLVYEITGSAAAPALFMLLRTLPRLLGPVVGGALADRFAATRALALIYTAQAAVGLGLYEAAAHRSASGIYIAVIVSQLIGSAARPMQQAIIPGLVSDEQIHRASATFGTGVAVVLFVAPAVGVALLRAHGADLLIAIDVASFVIAAGILFTFGKVGQARSPSEGPTWRSAAAGVAPMLGDPVLRTLVGTYLASALLTGVVQASIVVIAADRFGGADVSGFLYAALGVGGIVGGVIVTARPPHRVGRDTLFSAGALAMIPLAALVATRSLWQALLLMAISAIGSVATDAWGPAEIALRVERRLLGRANAVMVMCSYVGVLLGAAVALVLVPTAGWPATVFGTAVVAITFAFVVAVTGRRRAAPQLLSPEPRHIPAAAD